MESSKSRTDYYSSSGSENSHIFKTRDRSGTVNNIITAYKDSSDILRQPYGRNEDEHHTRLGEHAAVLWKYNKITDITIKLRGVSYAAHKTVLSCYSKYFKEMLLESKGNVSIINLQLQSVTNEAFAILLQYMYTANLFLTCQNIGDVYTAARKLGMDGALQLCVKILTGKTRHDVHSVYTYVTARKLGLTEAASRALRTMCKRFEQIVGTPEFLDLTYDQVMEYLKSDVLATRSEVIVFLAALKWISVQYMEREQFATEIISCVRFPLMSLNEVLACHSPPLLPGILEMPQIKQMLLEGTCLVAAKTINEERRFYKYDCTPRTYLLDKEPIILWDPNIFDPDRHAMYAEEIAATTIQATYRGFQTRKQLSEEQQAATVIQKAYRGYHKERLRSQLYPETPQGMLDDEIDYTSLEDERFAKKKFPFADKIRKSVTNIFKRAALQIQASEELSKLRKLSLDRKKSMGTNRELTPDDKEYPASRWDPNRTSNEGTLADAVNNRSSSDLSETEPKASKNGKKKTKRKKRKRKSEAGSLKKGGSLDYRSRVPEWSTSLDTLACTVESMANTVSASLLAKNEEKEWKESKGKRGYPFLSDEEESLDSLLAKERDYESLVERSKSEKQLETYRAIIVTGGFNAKNTDDPDSGKLVLLYDPASNQWSGIGLMPKPRHHHCTVYMKNFLYLIGGCHPELTKEGKMVPLKSCYSFNLTTKEWKKLPDMRNARMYHGVAALKGKIYVVGGKKDNDIMLDSVEVYNTKTNAWTIVDTLDYPTMGAGVCSHRGQVWVLGGMSESRGKISLIHEVRCYDPQMREWVRNIPSLPYPRAFIGAVECMNRLFIMGGTSYADSDIYSDDLNSLDEVIYFEEEERTWKTITRMMDPRHFVGAAAVGRSLFALGGLSSYKKGAIDEVNVYTETNNQWHKCTNLPVSLCGFAATAIPNVLN